MKRIVHLNEQDIKRIVVRVLKEESGESFKTAMTSMADLATGSLQSFMDELTGKKPSPSSDTETSSSDTSSSDTKISTSSGADSDFMNITKKVIQNFEGGYWNPFCPSHPKGGMGKSTETLFGLDRYNGNIESTPEGKEFFRMIDDEKRAMGATSSGSGSGMKWSNMDRFCKKWKWNSRGGDKEQKLKELAASIMKKRFDSHMSSFVKDSKTRQKIMNNKGLLIHMSYATWNGSGFFKKFANKLEQGVKQGMSDKELIDLAIQSRSSTGLIGKGKVERGIRNPDSLQS